MDAYKYGRITSIYTHLPQNSEFPVIRSREGTVNDTIAEIAGSDWLRTPSTKRVSRGPRKLSFSHDSHVLWKCNDNVSILAKPKVVADNIISISSYFIRFRVTLLNSLEIPSNDIGTNAQESVSRQKAGKPCHNRGFSLIQARIKLRRSKSHSLSPVQSKPRDVLWSAKLAAQNA